MRKKILSKLSSVCLIGLLFVFLCCFSSSREIVDEEVPKGSNSYSAYFYLYNGDIDDFSTYDIFSKKSTYIGSGTVKSKTTIWNNSKEVKKLIIKTPTNKKYSDVNIEWKTMTPWGKQMVVIGQISYSAESSNSVSDELTVITVDSVERMISTSCQVGQTIKTSSYYQGKNVGGAEYKVINSTQVKSKDIVIGLNNGLSAKLILSDSIDLYQVGAYGDGIHDDSGAFLALINSNCQTINLSDGNYYLNGNVIELPKKMSLIGTQNDAIVTSGCFRVAQGIEVRNLSFKGGATCNITCPGVDEPTMNVMFLTTPQSSSVILFENCSFSEADFVSFAYGTTYFESDTVRNCSFKDINHTAIYHSVNIEKSIYENNTFERIGNSTISQGPVSAIWLGDVTNITYTRAKDVTIRNNSFYTLTAADDPSLTSHIINCNFISIRGDNAIIESNHLEDVVGYGEDREAIYTKVRNLSIINNYVKNGGTGEAYICNKSDDNCIKNIISGNTLIGDYGRGIRSYGSTTISDNTIEITHCIAAITVTCRTTSLCTDPLIITNNIISCDMNDSYVYNGIEITDYCSKSIIQIANFPYECNIEANHISTATSFKNIISAGNCANTVSIQSNTINSNGSSCTGILYYFTNTDSVNTTAYISGNSINVSSGSTAIKYAQSRAENTTTERTISISTNTLCYLNSNKKETIISINSAVNNYDTISLNDNTVNLDSANVLIKTTANTLTGDYSFGTIKN